MSLLLPVARRRLLSALPALPLLSLSCGPAQAQPAGRVLQLLDLSPGQQELARDYATGWRLAWAQEGSRGRLPARIELETVSTDGSPEAVRAALDRVQRDTGVIALAGTVGDALALRVQEGLRQRGLAVAHLAPWLADDRFDQDERLALLFASRATQLQKALASARGMGVDELCVVYGRAEDRSLYDPQVAAMARAAGLKLQRVAGTAQTPAAALAQQLPARSAMVLVLAPAAEVAQLTQAMARRGDRRFVLALGDVDAATLMQFAPGRGVPVILTQVVPNPLRSRLAVVDTYRRQLAQLYDEAPSPISLAGYLAGLYTLALLRDAGPGAGRERVLEGVARRRAVSLDGWTVDFRDGRRGSQLVNPTLLGPGGELVG